MAMAHLLPPTNCHTISSLYKSLSFTSLSSVSHSFVLTLISPFFPFLCSILLSPDSMLSFAFLFFILYTTSASFFFSVSRFTFRFLLPLSLPFPFFFSSSFFTWSLHSMTLSSSFFCRFNWHRVAELGYLVKNEVTTYLISPTRFVFWALVLFC